MTIDILSPELIRYESVGLSAPSPEIGLLDVVCARYLASNIPLEGMFAFLELQF